MGKVRDRILTALGRRARAQSGGSSSLSSNNDHANVTSPTTTKAVNHINDANEPIKPPFMDEVHWEPSSHDIKMLRRTWRGENDRFCSQVGLDTYAFVFERLPEVQKLFPKVYKAGKNWRSCAEFEIQARRFVNVITYTLQMLDDAEQVNQYLCQVGARHVTFSERGFRAKYWELFKSAIHSAMSNQVESGEHINVKAEQRAQILGLWDHLAVYMTRRMFTGFCEELVRQREEMQKTMPRTPKIFRKKEDKEK